MTSDHAEALARLMDPRDPPDTWTGLVRPGPRLRRHTARDLLRARWRRLAAAEAQAASDAGEPDVASAFDAVMATLTIHTERPEGMALPRGDRRGPETSGDELTPPPCRDARTFGAHQSQHYRRGNSWGCHSCEDAA